MEAVRLAIPEIILFKPKRHQDIRGYVSESFRQDNFAANLEDTVTFVQENQLFSKDVNTIRGFHYQGAPRPQGKLVKVIHGAILDFALDIRRGSPTFGQVVHAELSLENGHQLWMPAGFAHGFVTLAPDTHVLNKLTDFYHPGSEGVVAWNDPDVAAPWPDLGSEPTVSDRDSNGARLKDLASPFAYTTLVDLPVRRRAARGAK